jgi:hypothetical protein
MYFHKLGSTQSCLKLNISSFVTSPPQFISGRYGNVIRIIYVECYIILKMLRPYRRQRKIRDEIVNV